MSLKFKIVYNLDQKKVEKKNPHNIFVGICHKCFVCFSYIGSESGEQQLIVSMEFNGVQYEGILLASRDSRPSLTPSISPQSNKRTSAGPSSSVSANSPINDERNERVSVNSTRPLVS